MSEDAHTISAVQTSLFPGLPLPPTRSKNAKGRTISRPNGFARPPGTGPQGETCGTCVHCAYTGSGKRRYPKCDVIRFRWTHGPGTDILVRSPACEMWQGF